MSEGKSHWNPIFHPFTRLHVVCKCSWYSVLTDSVCVCVVDIDRNQVFQTTRVRTTLKNDVSWIQKSKQDKKEEDKARYGVNVKQL